jgi:DNA-binding NarL/FixJ family response regulator
MGPAIALVLILTSSDSPSDRDAVQKLGAEAYFRKPTDLTAYLKLAKIIARIHRRWSGK